MLEAVADIATLYPEKRQEAIEWFSDIIDRILEEGPSASFTNYNLNGILVDELLDIHAEELLPKIKLMYDRNLVDRSMCGYYEDVKQEMKAGDHHNDCIKDIKLTYRELDRTFGRN